MTEIEQMIHSHATPLGFRLIGSVQGDLRVYFRDSPEASARLRLSEAEHEMLRGVDVFDRWLERKFEK